MTIRCRTCNTTFHDNGSLEIHYQYTHNNNLNSVVTASASAVSCVDSQDITKTNESDTIIENNNNFYHQPTTNAMTAISPGNDNNNANDANHDYPVNSPVNLQQQQQHRTDLTFDNNNRQDYSTTTDPTYILSDDFNRPQQQQEYADTYPRTFPRSHDYNQNYNTQDFQRQDFSRVISSSQTANSTTSPIYQQFPSHNEQQRYHPYYKAGFREPTNNRTNSTMLQVPSMRCDRCEFFCASPEVLHQHINLVHGHTLGVPGIFTPRYGNNAVGNGGAEPQAEILDLDSHKVHVYQPPNESENPENPALRWMSNEEKKYYDQQQMQIGHHNGGGGTNGTTPLSSPDFGNVSTTTENVENLQTGFRGAQYEQNQPSTSSSHVSNQISSSETTAPTTKSKSGKNKNNDASWKSNEPRRPKTYNCSACNKWFTSSGHLKRHYNTTLHKNAVKQSGQPDPAAYPISSHHHPQKDPTYPSSGRQKQSPPEPDPPEPPVQSKVSGDNLFTTRTPTPQQVPVMNSFLHNPPNLMAGPSEIAGGLLLPPSFSQPGTQDLIKSPSPITSVPLHSNHTSYLPFTTTQHPGTLPFFQQHTTPLYPNFQSPHVSTIQQVTKNNLIGNFESVLPNSSIAAYTILSADDKIHFLDARNVQTSLPSFACIQRAPGNTSWNLSQLPMDQLLCTLDNGNVGGFSVKQEPGKVENGNCLNNAVDSSTEAIGKEKFETIFPKVEPVYNNVEPMYCKEEPMYCKEEPMFSEIEPLYNKEPMYTDIDSAYTDIEPRYNTIGSVSVYVKVESPDSNDTLFEDKENSKINGSPDVSSSTTESSPAPPKRFECLECQKEFNRACYLTQHNKTFHAGQRPHKCDKCGKRYTCSQQLEEHKRKHAGEKPYKCDLCPKQFNHKTDLKRHECLHTNRRPYRCDVCNKGFIRNDHMLKHRETHFNKKQVYRRARVYKRKNLLKQVVC